MTTVQLPLQGGTEPYRLGQYEAVPLTREPIGDSRIAYAAAHVVADADREIDWDATISFRHHLWSLGLGVADAMDTAQRGGGLSAHDVRELIRRTAQSRPDGARLVCGVTTDELEGTNHDLASITAAYRDQMRFVEEVGSDAVMMASRALAAVAKSADDYSRVYSEVLRGSTRPVLLHAPRTGRRCGAGSGA